MIIYVIMYVTLGDSTLASATGCETKKRAVYTDDFLSRTSNRDLSSLRSSTAGYIKITKDLKMFKSLETMISLEFVAPAITTTLPLGSTTAASAEATCGSRQLRCSSGTRPGILYFLPVSSCGYMCNCHLHAPAPTRRQETFTLSAQRTWHASSPLDFMSRLI